MESFLEQGFQKKTVYGIISELKNLPNIVSLEFLQPLIENVSNRYSTPSELLKLFCLCAWVLNKSKIKQISDIWVSILGVLLLKASSIENKNDDSIELTFTDKDQLTFNKVSCYLHNYMYVCR
jgi:hypothetical protein